MAKYVCDFDAINKASQNLEKLASEMENNVKSGQKNLDSDLVTWTGTASNAYKDSSESISNHLNSDAETMRNYAAYLKEVESKIQEAESSLASMKI